MESFNWGKVIKKFEYDFDGHKMTVIKYHPYKYADSIATTINEDKIIYSCKEINRSCGTLDQLIIAYLVDKHLGRNNTSLSSGISRMLGII